MSTKLAERKCIPCEGGIPPLRPEQTAELLAQLGGSWKVVENHHLENEYTFPDFLQALAAVNRIGQLAEAQGHHPDLLLAWGKVGITLWTHKIDGLTESDFILAAKVDEII
ncbi:MAG: 4a-hydroxytetrahydrobiopterin dehydratase [Gemmatimonadetes bacterium]|nr:4a-hydroxytetrahydrobiopterin dehydratase [Gemmatimonadota bacterium]